MHRLMFWWLERADVQSFPVLEGCSENKAAVLGSYAATCS